MCRVQNMVQLLVLYPLQTKTILVHSLPQAHYHCYNLPWVFWWWSFKGYPKIVICVIIRRNIWNVFIQVRIYGIREWNDRRWWSSLGTLDWGRISKLIDGLGAGIKGDQMAHGRGVLVGEERKCREWNISFIWGRRILISERWILIWRWRSCTCSWQGSVNLLVAILEGIWMRRDISGPKPKINWNFISHMFHFLINNL